MTRFNLIGGHGGGPRCAMLVRLCVCLYAAVVLGGCTTLGPRTIPADRFDYSAAIGESWKKQTLLNIVKMRYMDLPVFVDVASIVAGYSVETTASVGVQGNSGGTSGNLLTLGGSGKYTDRPTITYAPQTGEKFLRGLLTPIEPKNIFFMLQSGYAADFLLGLTVESLNGVRNRSMTGGIVQAADPEFVRALELLRDVQAAGGIGMSVEENKVTGSTAVLFFRGEDVAPDIAAKSTELRRILKLADGQQKFTLVYSPVRGPDAELSVTSRSMLQILMAFATYIDVPEEDRLDGIAAPSSEPAPSDGRAKQMRIHSGKDKPASAFAAVRYRGHWFWIADDDWAAKRAMTAVMYFFTLTDSGGNERLPMITIPAQ